MPPTRLRRRGATPAARCSMPPDSSRESCYTSTAPRSSPRTSLAPPPFSETSRTPRTSPPIATRSLRSFPNPHPPCCSPAPAGSSRCAAAAYSAACPHLLQRRQPLLRVVERRVQRDRLL